MKERRSLKAIRDGLCFFLLAAMTACTYGETEVAEDEEETTLSGCGFYHDAFVRPSSWAGMFVIAATLVFFY